MTAKEAIKELEYDKELYNTDAHGKPLDPELLEGTPDGALVDALDMAIEALQKQVPKKPNVICMGGRLACECPICTTRLSVYETARVHGASYCTNCGQAIDCEE